MAVAVAGRTTTRPGVAVGGVVAMVAEGGAVTVVVEEGAGSGAAGAGAGATAWEASAQTSAISHGTWTACPSSRRCVCDSGTTVCSAAAAIVLLPEG